MSSAESTAAPSNAAGSPAWNLITNLDFRLESLQQLVKGELRPLERRANLVRNGSIESTDGVGVSRQND
jgi:hypothetical protein